MFKPDFMHREGVALGVLAALVLAAGSSAAQARPDTRQMSCAAVQATVDREGVVVMTTGPTTYNRFVDRDGYCEVDQIVRRIIVPASDTPRCRVRGVCQTNPFYDLPGIGDD